MNAPDLNGLAKIGDPINITVDLVVRTNKVEDICLARNESTYAKSLPAIRTIVGALIVLCENDFPIELMVSYATVRVTINTEAGTRGDRAFTESLQETLKYKFNGAAAVADALATLVALRLNLRVESNLHLWGIK